MDGGIRRQDGQLASQYVASAKNMRQYGKNDVGRLPYVQP